MPYDGIFNEPHSLNLPKDLDFEVFITPVSDILKEGISVNNSKSAVIDQFGHVFGFTSNRYKPLSYADTVASQNEAIYDSGIDLRGMRVKWSKSSDGGRMKRYITFPSATIEPVVGDITQFGLELYNSYDSSYCYESATKAFRLWCLNGCTTPEHTYNSRRKHTTNVSISGETAKLQLGIDAFYDSESRYQKWSRTPILKSSVERLFKKTLTAKEGGKFPYAVTSFDNLMVDWKNTERDMGSNAWSAYNVATAWATHAKPKRGGFKENLVRTRNAKVASMLKSDYWKELVDGTDV
jgi:hypothetical protein